MVDVGTERVQIRFFTVESKPCSSSKHMKHEIIRPEHKLSSWCLTASASALANVQPSNLQNILGNFSTSFSASRLLLFVSFPLHSGQGLPSWKSVSWQF